MCQYCQQFNLEKSCRTCAADCKITKWGPAWGCAAWRMGEEIQRQIAEQHKKLDAIIEKVWEGIEKEG